YFRQCARLHPCHRYKWLHNKAKVSPEHVGSIVTATGGVVKAYQIRPDLPKLFPHTEKNAA
ncbi:hypothetical protein ACVD6V_24285, partial [Escherichia coli]|uniref:transcriptional regulator n=2 Tax=Escherichia coli TaxID=562 RepID=UPI001118A364